MLKSGSGRAENIKDEEFKMIVIENLMQYANQIESERGVSKEVLFSAIEQAIVSVCRRHVSQEAELEAILDRDTGGIKVYQLKTVVEDVQDPELEISLGDVENADLGATLRYEVEVTDLGRIAAQTAKQVILQRIREAEKESVYNEFKVKEGKLVTGSIQQIENQNYLINLGRTEAILYYREQVPGERFYVKDKIKLYVASVEKGARGNIIRVSRTHPGLLRCLFELEIPEIQDKIIEVKSVSREAGKRSKVAVMTNNPSIGAVGTCVGQMGGRIQSIIKELGNEKIDVLEWDENPRVFISNALKPAQVSQVIITSEEEKTAIVVVPNDQLSLAIGKQGINVRLSVSLTGWRLDIMKEEDYNKNAMQIAKDNKLSIEDKMKTERDSRGLVEKLSASRDDREEPNALENSLLQRMKKEKEAFVVKVKVSELAKQLDLKTQELIDKAKEFGVDIKSNRSILTDEQIEKIKENLN